MKKILPLVVLFSVLSATHDECAAAADNDTQATIIQHEILRSSLPVVLAGSRLGKFIGKPVSEIRLLAFNGSEFVSIPFQIDLRDDEGKYVIEEDDRRPKENNFDENDEFVFMSIDAARKAFISPDHVKSNQMVEIEISDPVNGMRRWAYAVADNGHYDIDAKRYVNYEAQNDAVHSDSYRIGFSSEQPFIVDELNRRNSGGDDWSGNLVDTMKLKHKGTMLGLLDFERNHADYSSKLVAVKEGPIRVLRRTANKVRILWWLKSPQVLIDYIAHQNGFQMDIIIDIPFKIGLVFSEIESIASIDWNSDESLSRLEIVHSEVKDKMLVDGKMSVEESRLNEFQNTDLVIVNDYGQIFVQMTMTEGTPILKNIYLVDDSSAMDQPEKIPGQFGNIGFRTYNWEKLDTTVSHMFFNAHLTPPM